MAALLLTVLPFGGCAPMRRAPIGVPATPDERASLRELLEQRDSEISTGRILAHVKVTRQDDEGGSHDVVRGAFVFQKPHNFRLELFPLNTALTLQLLIASDRGTTLILPSEKTVVQSRTQSDGLLRSALKLPLAEQDLMQYLLGRVPSRFAAFISDTREARVSREPNTQHWLVELARFRDRWNLDPVTGLLHEATLYSRFDQEAEIMLRASYPAAHPPGTPLLPSTLTLTLPKERTQISFDIQRATINVPINEQLFEVSIPSDFRKIER